VWQQLPQLRSTRLLALIPVVNELFTDADGYIAVQEYGTCIVIGDALVSVTSIIHFKYFSLLSRLIRYTGKWQGRHH